MQKIFSFLFGVLMISSLLGEEDPFHFDVKSEFVTLSTDDDFDSIVKKGTTVVAVLSQSCNPCKRFNPVFNQVAKSMSGENIKFVKSISSSNAAVMRKIGVTKVPSILVYKNGTIVGSHVGALNAPEFKSFVKKYL